ncbi:HemK2/MTQ2 family protein methyltransferase [Streptomyces sp. NRRL S-87]|uniref:HemK2/MTQ2 family protein methyltransferase n=1 Tax=Streptomyces sp. NRRL S-87 TaxID=1463920 RepID=UPI000AC4DB7B|nr:HemK2/MTQ2 family protein methyltransferase [Streptomyces sp. NRRL S-87]
MTSTASTYEIPVTGLIAPPGVYRPQADTLLLADALARERLGPRDEVLEIGTGTGALALRAAARGATVTAVDIAWRAVLAARLNAWRRRLRLRVLHGDFAARTAGARFDLMLANPPYVPTPDASPPKGAARAWDAGADGRAVIDRVCAAAADVLRPGGVLLMVHSQLCGPERTLALLADHGLPAQVTDRAEVAWGPVLRSRRAWLQAQGLVQDGADREELVVVRARRL